MAWGGLFFRSDSNSVVELPDDYTMPPLGSMHFVHDRIAELFPNQTHTLGTSTIASESYWIELAYKPDDGAVDPIAVRCSGDPAALGCLLDVAENLGARLFDNQNGDFVGSVNDPTMKVYRDWKDSLK